LLVLSLHQADGGFLGFFEFSGGQSSLVLRYRSVVERVMANGAEGLLLVHNHPSGDPTPSRDDIASTAALLALCRPLSIRLHDHLVVGGNSLVSMRRAGLLGRAAAHSTSNRENG
jgi:DNA repair protein RadC